MTSQNKELYGILVGQPTILRDYICGKSPNHSSIGEQVLDYCGRPIAFHNEKDAIDAAWIESQNNKFWTYKVQKL